MANNDQLKKLFSGKDEWNSWKRNNSSVPLDFTNTNLNRKDFSGYNLISANFSGSTLVNANFSGAQLYGVKFNNSSLLGVNFQGAHLMDADLSFSNANGADFRNSFLLGTNLENSSVVSCKYNRWAIYRGIRLSGCHGSQRFIRYALDQSFIEEFRGESSARPLIPTDVKFHNIKQVFAFSKTVPSISKNPKGIIYLLWLASCDCGRSFSIWFFWSLFIALCFGAIYSGLEIPTWLPEPVANFLVDISPSVSLRGDRVETGFTPYYFSIVTFTTLGFGDVLPNNLAGEIWLTIEVIIGYIMLGGLISIFSSKVARRAS